MNTNTETAINNILKLFEEGNIPKAISYTVNPKFDVPSNDWSFNNRLIMFLHGTIDARGYKAWNEVNRNVKKGSKSFKILAPCTRKIKDENDEPVYIITGFRAIPVFKAEDTEGYPLEYDNIPQPELRLLNIAKSLGLDIVNIPKNGEFLGNFSKKESKIALATPEECVFFHELAHAVDSRLNNLEIQQGQQVDREIVAELTACTLGYMLDREVPKSLGNHFKYIERYARKEDMNVMSACQKHFSRVEAIINEIVRLSSTEFPPSVEMANCEQPLLVDACDDDGAILGCCL